MTSIQKSDETSLFLQENGVRDRARGGLIIAIEKRLELSLNSSILEYCGISNF